MEWQREGNLEMSSKDTLMTRRDMEKDGQERGASGQGEEAGCCCVCEGSVAPCVIVGRKRNNKEQE